MRIEDFNSIPAEEAAAVLRPCADIDWWIAVLISQRPYADSAELRRRAAELAQGFQTDDVDAALARHPRIGERPSGDDEDSRFSAAEQGALGPASASSALAAGNAAYEERFGRIFLIRAAGRDRADILAELHRRLHNDPEEEIAVVTAELTDIALRRLNETVTDE
jgi:2-oxo-4-hydroxy-4-carboxy-5-ureidoimidazoline decarboxylase